MSRDWRIYIQDMRDACEKVLQYTSGMDLAAFRNDSRTYDAVVRNLSTLGQAAKYVPDDVRNRSPEIEWRKIAGLRDIVITHTSI